ncbi:transcriptional regulator [Tepiditoga spiralis]|uniref:Transcriptional regulator n=1 Tax=Tepiditoga spiralis TaxID=2108365 RepID=A0A7G1GC55_9BACT|nr:helix-turn-helix domain-containing protein [Tepiditoga spiralis]BBE31779.1 transcriptional regulator [Tepiditoga spiralis]
MNSFNRKLEMNDGLETKYMKVLYYDFNSYYKGSYKSYEYPRLCTILEGEKRVTINSNEKFIYNKDQFILLPSNSSVEMEIQKPTKAFVLEISNELIHNISNQISIKFNVEQKEVSLFKSKVNLIDDVLNKIHNVFLQNTKNKEFLLDLYAQEITYSLLTNELSNSLLCHENTLIQKAISKMKNDFLNNLTVNDLANYLSMSTSNFSTYFKKCTGISPNNYLKNLKLNEAKKRLLNESVTDVAYDLGYENISYFIKIFKEKFGITPKQFQLKDFNLKF